MFIQQKNAFWGEMQDDKLLRTELKKWGVDGRRMSRFSQLALLGALPLREQITPDTPIFFASPFASPSKFNKMFTQLNEQDLPSPLDFMANLNNAALFLLAQQFQTTAQTVFLAADSQSFWQPLQLAELALKQHSQVLVGWAFEHSEENQAEGSLWWLISNELKGSMFSFETVKQQQVASNGSFSQRLENLISFV